MRFVARILALALLVNAATHGHASADAEAGARPYAFQLGVAWLEPISMTRMRFGSGFGLQLGASVQPHPLLAVQLAYMVSTFDVRSGVLSGAVLGGDQLMQSWSLNLRFSPLHGARARFYVLAGPGVYARRVDLVQARGDGVAAVCDAWLLVCSDRVTPASALPGSRHSTDFGLRGGLGVDFAVGGEARLYAEATYEFIWSADLHAPAGTISSASSEYVPIVVGVAF